MKGAGVHRRGRRSYRNVWCKKASRCRGALRVPTLCAQKRAGRTAAFGAKLAQFVADALHGKGNVIEVTGVAGTGRAQLRFGRRDLDRAAALRAPAQRVSG
jgi:hypothetical protein